MKTERKALRLTPELSERIARLAKADGRSFTNMIERLVETGCPALEERLGINYPHSDSHTASVAAAAALAKKIGGSVLHPPKADAPSPTSAKPFRTSQRGGGGKR
jgi:hypothetical protein